MKLQDEGVYSLSELQKYAREFAAHVRPDTTIALYGPLGSGKTTFVKAFAKQFGVKHIVSPTFTLMNVYSLKRRGLRYLCHVDAYRIKDGSDLKQLGFEDYLVDPKTICIIEWADRVRNILPKKRMGMWFSHVDEAHRRIRVSSSL